MAKNRVKRGYFSKLSTVEITVSTGPVPALGSLHIEKMNQSKGESLLYRDPMIFCPYYKNADRTS
jgi:hypothetical protein